MPRLDISQYLVHWTSGDDDEAFQNLFAILLEMKLRGNNENIKGNHYCICFTEAPENEFHKLRSRYKPFGVQVPKKWLFERGGRPVIYQTDAEYNALPDGLKWRHVRYDPIGNPPIDFTWEREWRFHDYELELSPDVTRVLLPSQAWAERLISDYAANQQFENMWKACAYGEDYIDAQPEGFSLAY